MKDIMAKKTLNLSLYLQNLLLLHKGCKLGKLFLSDAEAKQIGAVLGTLRGQLERPGIKKDDIKRLVAL